MHFCSEEFGAGTAIVGQDLFGEAGPLGGTQVGRATAVATDVEIDCTGAGRIRGELDPVRNDEDFSLAEILCGSHREAVENPKTD